MLRWVCILAVLVAQASCVPVCDTDADCDDGVWCNGDESCAVRSLIANLLLPSRFRRGVCSDGEPPCCPAELDCSEWGSRYIAIEICNEAEQLCETGDECQVDEECDDGIWCTGDESCISGFCFQIRARCEYLETCDEEQMQCKETNKLACFRILDLCPNRSRTGELASIALVLGTTDVPEDTMIFGDGVCEVPETADCAWSSYADCVTAHVTCKMLKDGRPEDALSNCLDILTGNDCFVDVG